MRLQRQQVLQGLLHDDISVRQYCLDYFTDELQADKAVMPMVIEAVELYGHEAFYFLRSTRDLSQTDSTIEWIIKSFRDQPRLPDAETTLDWIDLLTRCESSLLDRYQADILSVLPAQSHIIIHRRLSYASVSAEELWNQLQELCQRQMLSRGEEPFPQQHIDDLVLALAERKLPPEEQLLPLLQQELLNNEDSLAGWLAPHIIELAGRARYHSVLPCLIDMLRIDSDFIPIESQRALIRFGSDEVARTVAEVFLQEDWSWQNAAGEVFRSIHSEESIRQAISLLRNDSLDEEIHQLVAFGLASQSSTEALETIGEYLESHQNWLGDPEWQETFDVMEAASTLLNFKLPQFDSWRMRMEEQLDSPDPSSDPWMFAEDEESEFEDEDFDFRPSGAIVYNAPRVGRNDPCPCGSGKKFKSAASEKI